jgi:hypothetical protein
MTDIDMRLTAIESKLDRLADTMQSIAVQKEKIDRLEERMHGIWARYDDQFGPNGVIARIREHQASCPRTQVKTMWCIILPMGLTLLGMGFALLRAVP